MWLTAGWLMGSALAACGDDGSAGPAGAGSGSGAPVAGTLAEGAACSDNDRCAPAAEPCQSAVCVSGRCRITTDVTGTAVADDQPGDCKQLRCGPGGMLETHADPQDVPPEDGDPCTVDNCSPLTGCFFNMPVTCNDNNGCTDDYCDPAIGCVFTPNDANCDDGKPCTIDTCDPIEGCEYKQSFAPECVDGPFCEITGDAGDQVVCPVQIARASAATPLPVAVQFDISYDPTVMEIVELFDNNCAFPDKGISCGFFPVPPGNLYPSGHAASISPGLLGDWDGSGTVQFIDIAGGGQSPISNAFLEEGTMINDPVVVWVRLALTEDVLTPSALGHPSNSLQGSITDASEMTAQVIDSVIVFDFACDVDDDCDDGDACTDNFCVMNSCAIAPTNCDDGNACTNDDCDAVSGCSNIPNDIDCDDGFDCTESDTCNDGECSGAPLDCDDNNVCTDDDCSESLGGVCVHPPIGCNDNDACTDNLCNPSDGCYYPPTNCDDGSMCTIDLCSGGCINVLDLDVCNDGNSCTIDFCDPVTGCSSSPISGVECIDQDFCQSEGTCLAGVCEPIPEFVCDDNNVCTEDFCDPEVGCVNAPVDCDDDSVCTQDGCHVESNGCFHNILPCDDGIDCTDDVCDPIAGCEHTADNSFCGALLSDVCQAAACQPTEPAAMSNGCVIWDDPDDTPCDDSDLCTTDDACLDGNCQPGTPLNCDDEDVCTADSCVDGICTHEPIGGPCDDGDACTEDDTCVNGFCTPGTQVNCDDDDTCTVDVCDPIEGCINDTVAANGIACELSGCTQNSGMCLNGLCENDGSGTDDCLNDPDVQLIITENCLINDSIQCVEDVACIAVSKSWSSSECELMPFVCEGPDGGADQTLCLEGLYCADLPRSGNQPAGSKNYACQPCLPDFDLDNNIQGPGIGCALNETCELLAPGSPHKGVTCVSVPD